MSTETATATETGTGTRVHPWDEKRRAMREEIERTGQRPCLACGKTLPLVNFPTGRGPGNRQARCFDCLRPLWRELGKKDRKRQTRNRLDYDRRNREHVRTVRNNYTRRCYATKTGAYESMRAARERARLRRIAIETGKASPICKLHGFALVVNETMLRENNVGEWRNARLDKPIQTGERAICHYRFVETANRWVVLSAPLARPSDRRLIAALVAREGGRKA